MREFETPSINIYGRTPVSIAPKNRLHQNEANIPTEAVEAAQMYENEFSKLMLEEMDKTVEDSDDSNASKYYKSLLNSERATLMGKVNNGIGIREMILKQLYPSSPSYLSKVADSEIQVLPPVLKEKNSETN